MSWTTTKTWGPHSAHVCLLDAPKELARALLSSSLISACPQLGLGQMAVNRARPWRSCHLPTGNSDLLTAYTLLPLAPAV